MTEACSAKRNHIIHWRMASEGGVLTVSAYTVCLQGGEIPKEDGNATGKVNSVVGMHESKGRRIRRSFGKGSNGVGMSLSSGLQVPSLTVEYFWLKSKIRGWTVNFKAAFLFGIGSKYECSLILCFEKSISLQWSLLPKLKGFYAQEKYLDAGMISVKTTECLFQKQEKKT